MDKETRKKRKLGYILIGVALAVGLIMLYFYYVFPYFGIGPPEPIAFSHRLHAGVKRINCRFCHSFTERSKKAGIPAVEKCFFCHEYIIPMHPQLVTEREHYNDNRPVPWKRIYYVPDFVKFRHKPHVGWAKIECNVCHGPVQTMDRLEEKHFKMGFCIGCHRSMDAQMDCWLSCHH